MTVTPTTPPISPSGAAPSPSRWTGGRVTSVVIGSLVAMLALGLVLAGAVATWLTNTQRDAAGYVTTATHAVSTAGYAITTDTIDLGSAADVVAPADIFGTVRLHVTSDFATRPVFVGVGPTGRVNAYLAGVSRQLITTWAPFGTRQNYAGGAPRVAPQQADFWTAQTVGTGRQSLTWRPTAGHWTVVVMNADARPGVSIRADIGARFPDLAWYAAGLFLGGVAALAVATALIAIPIVRAGRPS